MIDELGIHSEEEKHRLGTNQITSSVQQNIDDVLNFFNITIIGDEGTDTMFKGFVKDELKNAKENKETLGGAYVIYVENKRGGRERSDCGGINDAIGILSKNPEAKIILMGFMPEEYLRQEKEEFNFVMAHANVVCLDMLTSAGALGTLKFKGSIDKDNYLGLADKEAKKKMGYIRHGLQGMKDPYHPQDEYEKNRVERAFKEAQEYFPGLDTIDKMLDFVVHVNIDIPEKMKGQKIQGVYCDVDGTLIEYVGINSGKEGTQQLRQSVVDRLKKYEQEGKEIYIRTGGNVEKKAAYLKTLGIDRPVVNKCDYAGATAEIVMDDTDINAFIVQSKILPETYIDTKDRK
ncbi:MAG: HAD hydrolase family protein [candidate division SR1 bacterium]|nr:HAD hydrolase family protein [candidate division SR1 bacterium]